MSEQLTSNVFVNGRWYGPGYPQNGEPPAGSVTNPAAFADRDEDTGEVLRDEEGNPTRDGKPVQVEAPRGAHSPREQQNESRAKR